MQLSWAPVRQRCLLRKRRLSGDEVFVAVRRGWPPTHATDVARASAETVWGPTPRPESEVDSGKDSAAAGVLGVDTSRTDGWPESSPGRESFMPTSFKALALAGAVLIASAVTLASTATASATSSPPQVVTTYFGGTIYPCSNGTCAIGPGTVGTQFAAAMDGTGGPPYSGPESNAYQMSVVSGSLPPGLTLALPDAEWMIMGTPTKAGTYAFTVQIVALAGGPNGYQQFSITIGNGSSDKLEISSAAYLSRFGRLQVGGFDVNVGASYTVYATSTGAKIGTLGEVNSGDGQPFDGDGKLVSNFSMSPSNVPQQITVKDSLGGSVTVPVTFVRPYS
jgi:hypothetical protein